MTGLIDSIQKGGIVMVPILILGIVAVAICIERALYFYFTGIDYRKFMKDLLRTIKSDELINVKITPDEESGPLSSMGAFFTGLRDIRWRRCVYVKIAEVYIQNIQKGERSREEALKRTGSEEIDKMEKNFKGLSAISHISPLLGLLGTVTGIIQSFSVISRLGGQVDVTALAGGIWEAMITTAAGLIIAIPAQLAFLYFEKIVSSRASRMSYIVAYLNEELYSYAPDRGDERGAGREAGASETV